VSVVPGLVVAALLLAGPGPSAPPSSSSSSSSPVAGVYRNERGSLLTLSVAGGALTGSFRSAVGNVASDRRFPVVGVVNGDVVGFVVDFERAGSVGAWSGQLRGDELVLLWHLSRDVKDDEEKMGLWSSVLTGSDIFIRCGDCTP
jgi:hypothetical protein